MTDPAPNSPHLLFGHSWRSGLVLFLSITALAFLARFIYLDQARDCPLSGVLIMDARSYGEWSDRIVGTGGVAGDWLGSTVFYQAPLYPYTLAIIKLAVGHDLWNIRLVQIALGSIACGLIALAAARFFAFPEDRGVTGRRAGWLAGILLALYPPAIFYDTLIQKANLGLLWMAILLWVVSMLARNARRPLALAAGATLGLLVLTREETMLLAPALGLWLLLPDRNPVLARRLVLAACFAGGLAIPLLPVAIRNYHVGGEFALTTSQAGPNFYIGNNPNATGMYAPLRPGRSNTPWERQDAIELAVQETGRPLTPGQVSRFWLGKAFTFIRTQPGAWLKLEFRKAALLVNAYEVPDAEDQYFFERYSPFLRALSAVWHLGTLLPIAAVGLVLAWSHRRPRVLYLLAGTLAIGVLAFYVFGRYRYPLVPVIILFAGEAPFLLASTIAARRWRPLAGALTAAVLAAVAANWPLFARTHQLAAAYSNAGTAISESGKPQDAIPLLNEALRLNPAMPETRVNLALALARQGRLPEAVVELRQAVAARPDDPRLHFHLGTALAELGSNDEAAQHLGRAAADAPQDIDARVNYGMLLVRMQRWTAAADELRAAVRLAPPNPQNPASMGHAATLAWLLSTCTDPAARNGPEAVSLATDLCIKTGHADPDMLDVLAAALAESQRFPEAAATQRQAVDAAKRANRGDILNDLGARLSLYESGRPFRQ